MADVVVYSKDHCPYCDKAKDLLKEKGVTFREIRVDYDASQLKIMVEKSGRRTVPQIFINDESIGGFDDLAALQKAGKLDALLQQ